MSDTIARETIRAELERLTREQTEGAHRLTHLDQERAQLAMTLTAMAGAIQTLQTLLAPPPVNGTQVAMPVAAEEA